MGWRIFSLFIYLIFFLFFWQYRSDCENLTFRAYCQIFHCFNHLLNYLPKRIAAKSRRSHPNYVTPPPPRSRINRTNKWSRKSLCVYFHFICRPRNKLQSSHHSIVRATKKREVRYRSLIIFWRARNSLSRFRVLNFLIIFRAPYPNSAFRPTWATQVSHQIITNNLTNNPAQQADIKQKQQQK